MQGQLMKIWQDGLLTVVAVTHDIDEAIVLSTRIVVLSPVPGGLRGSYRWICPIPETVPLQISISTGRNCWPYWNNLHSEGKEGVSMKQSKDWKGSVVLVLTLVLMLMLGVQAMAAEKLTVSYNPMPLNVPSIVMKEMGFLGESMAELGVEVEYKSFLAGYQMTEAMAAGELDIAAVMGGTSTITSFAGGRDLQVFAAYGQAPAGFAIVAKTGTPFQSILDLKGKTVGVPVGTEAHYSPG